MREQIIARAKGKGGHSTNALRELLQWEVLAGLHGMEAFREVAFMGGTSLRLLHGLKRFSEDLDFSARVPGELAFLKELPPGLGKWLAGCGFEDAEVAPGKEHGAVVSAWVGFPGVLKEIGAASMASQKLRIKLEFDCNPPGGAGFSRHVVSSPSLMAIAAHDLPTLMAGKLHAVLARGYTKGRDWYDLLWYLGKRVEPNVIFLEAALAQQPAVRGGEAANWRRAVQRVVESVAWGEIRRDLEPFLEVGSEMEMIKPEFFLELLEI